MTARVRVRVPSCYFVISARVWEGAEPARKVKLSQVLKLETGTRGLEDCCHVNSIIPNTHTNIKRQISNRLINPPAVLHYAILSQSSC